MNKKEYNNVIEGTLRRIEQTEDTLTTARAILTNMGISLPQGDLQQVSETLATDDYMGWRKCTLKEAQDCVNEGTAVVGVNGEQIVVVAAEPEKDEADVGTDSTSVLTLSDSTPALAVADTVFYANRMATTTGGTNNSNIHFEQSSSTKKVGWSGYCLVPSDCSIMMVNFTSSNPAVASIEYVSGIITAHQTGKTIITATTTDGYSASYQLVVEELQMHEETTGTVSGIVINEAGIRPVAYSVDLTIYYRISAVQGNRVKIERISALARLLPGNPIQGVSDPSIKVDNITLNGGMLSTERDYEYIITDKWTWYAKKAVINRWVDLGSTIHSAATASMGAIPVVGTINLETSIHI